MHAAGMMLLCLLTVQSGDAPLAWVDAATHAGRDVLGYRNVVLRNETPWAAEIDRPTQPEWRYGLVLVGDNPGDAILLVHAPQADTAFQVGLDLDRDRRITAQEWHVLGPSPVEASVEVRYLRAGGGSATSPATHETLCGTLLLRGDGLGGVAWAVRGCRVGRVFMGATSHAAVLTDADADGLFHGVGADRLWVDLDGSGEFDPFTEQLMLGSPILFGGRTYVASADAEGAQLRMVARSDKRGLVRATLGLPYGGKLRRVNAALVSEIGELVSLTQLSEPIELPEGEYRLAGLQLEIEENNEVWVYHFEGTGSRLVRVRPEAIAEVSLLDGLTLDFVNERPRGEKNATVTELRPRIVAASGLESTFIGSRERQQGLRERSGEVQVVSGQRKLAHARAGFV
jgi:hypothetical protein